MAEAAKRSNVVFMENHGIVCGGRDIEEAEWFAENADAFCQCCLLAALHKKPLQQVGRKSVQDFLLRSVSMSKKQCPEDFPGRNEEFDETGHSIRAY